MTGPAKRGRELGLPFPGRPGPFNAITDVHGVEVGTVTLISGDGPLVGRWWWARGRFAPGSPQSFHAARTRHRFPVPPVTMP